MEKSFKTFYSFRYPDYEKVDPYRVVDELHAPSLYDYAMRAMQGYITPPKLMHDEDVKASSLKDLDRSMDATDGVDLSNEDEVDMHAAVMDDSLSNPNVAPSSETGGEQVRRDVVESEQSSKKKEPSEATAEEG